MSKWVIDVRDGSVCDIAFGADSNFVRMMIAQFKRSDDENVKSMLVPKLEDYLDRCKNKQHVFLVLSDGGVYLDGPLDSVRPETELISDEDMKL